MLSHVLRSNQVFLNYYKAFSLPCMEEPPNHLLVQWFTRTKMTGFLYSHTNSIYYNKKIQSKISKGKTHRVKYRGNQAKSQESFSSEVTWDLFHSSSNVLWQHLENVYQGSSLDARFPGLLLRASHVGTHCLAHSKIPGSQRKAGVKHKTYCLFHQNIKLYILNIHNFYLPIIPQ